MLAALVGAVLAGAARHYTAGTVAVVLAVCVAISTVVFPTVKAAVEANEKAAVARRGSTAGAAADPLVRDVDLVDTKVHASLRPDIEYVKRDLQDDIARALRDTRRVLIVGPSMAGKTRLALALAREMYPDWALHRPADGRSMHAQLTDTARFDQVIVWLDDLQEYTATGLTVDDLRTLTDPDPSGQRPDVVVIATIRTVEWDNLQPNDLQRLPGYDVCRWFGKRHTLPSRWSEDELERLKLQRTGRTVEHEARRYGLAAYLAGAPLVDDLLQTAPHTHPEGYAVVRAATDWRRAGMQQDLTLGSLIQYLPAYLPSRQTQTVEEQARMGLSWATAKINDTIALVTDRDGLRAEDLLLDRFANATFPISMLNAAAELASHEERLTLGIAAAETRLPDGLALARTLFTQAADDKESSAPVPSMAMFNLGSLLVQLVDPPDLDGARYWYRRAADAGNTNAMYNLGFMLAELVDPPDLEAARHWYRRAADAGNTAGMVGLGYLLDQRDDPPDLEAAEHWYRQAADAGNTHAMVCLAYLHANQVDPPDLKAAEHWYRQAADAGHTEAINHLAALLDRQPDLRNGVEPSSPVRQMNGGSDLVE